MDSARYRDRDHSADADEYNLQSEEKDANAFGWAMVEIMTDGKVRPTFPGLKRETVAAIEFAKNEIIAELKTANKR